MKKYLALFLLLCFSPLSAHAADLEQTLLRAEKAARPAPVSDYKTNPLFSLRAYVAYDAPDPDEPGSSIGLSTECNALLYTPDGMIILDEHGTQALKDGFAAAGEVNLMVSFARFGYFWDEGKRQPHYYAAYGVTEAKITFDGNYARFWVPIHTPSLLKKTAALRFPRRPTPAELKDIFTGKPAPIREKYKNIYYNPFIDHSRQDLL